jgi:crossover junction endodeoxyribonuclease RusA
MTTHRASVVPSPEGMLPRQSDPASTATGRVDGFSATLAVDPPRVLVIKVYGMPGPQGSKRFVGLSKSGRGLMVESSKKVKPWREDVKAAAELIRAGADPLDCPLRLHMVFTLPKPASAPKRRRIWPMRTPDLSKLCRSTEDALTQSGIWRDDARVCEYGLLAKRYPNEGRGALEAPGCWIEIERLDMLPCNAQAVAPELFR